MNPNELLQGLVSTFLQTNRPQVMTDADAMREGGQVVHPSSPTSDAPMSIDELSALIGEETPLLDPRVVDQLMHRARQRFLPDQVPIGPHRSNEYFIPEFNEYQLVPLNQPAPVVEEPQDPRVAALQAAHGQAGFTFEIDDKGQMVISNTEETRQAALQKSARGLNTAEPSQAQKMAPLNFTAAMQAIEQERNPTVRAQMMGELASQVNMTKSEMLQEALQSASNRIGLDRLEQTLAQNEALDRQDENWGKFQSDSPITARIRQQVAQAREQAQNEAQRMLSSNPTYVAMDAQLAAAAKVFDRQEASTLRRDERQEMSQFNRELKINEMIEGLGPKLGMFPILYPELSNSSPEQVALFATKVQDKDVWAAIEAQPEDLIGLSLVMDNSHATKLLVAREAERTGKTEVQINAELAEMRRAMNMAPDGFAAVVRDIYPGDKATQDGILQTLRLASVGGTNAQQEQAKMQRFDLITSRAARIKEREIINNVSSWGIVDPDLQAAVQAARSSDGEAKAADVFKRFTAGLEGQALSARQEQFFDYAEHVSRQRAQDLIAPVNPSVVRTLIMNEATRMTLWDRIARSYEQEAGLPAGSLPDVGSVVTGQVPMSTPGAIWAANEAWSRRLRSGVEGIFGGSN